MDAKVCGRVSLAPVNLRRLALAQAWALFDQWEQVYACATFAGAIKARTNSIENDELAWGELHGRSSRR